MTANALQHGAAPVVSVLIPAYQAEWSLEFAVRSALVQSMPDIEVLVLDDGSTDGTLSVARELAEEDGRVRLLTSGVNTGPAATRNRGLAAARGTWIGLLDADDAWLPDRLERLLTDAGDADVVCDDVLVLDGPTLAHGALRGFRVLPWLGLRLDAPRPLGLTEFIRHDLGYLQPVLRRSALAQRGVRYTPELRVAEDFSFAVTVLASGLVWKQFPDAYYCYRRGQPSLSASATAVAERQEVLVAALLALPEVSASPEAVHALRSHMRQARATLAYHEWRDLLRDQGLARACADIARDVDVVPLLLGKVARRVRLAALRRLLRADRLPEQTATAVRELWGLPPVAARRSVSFGAGFW